MSEKKIPSPMSKNALNHHLKHFVSFGEPSRTNPPPATVTGRLKELVRKVEDLNRRVDRLKDRF
ncbi:hypothetical protein EBQ90_05750 [bacterium]|nr:hypothetical protein [bacterium]